MPKARTKEEWAAYMRDYRARRRERGGLRNPPKPKMEDLVRAAWTRVGRPSALGFDFVCNCGVCASLRAKTKEPV